MSDQPKPTGDESATLEENARVMREVLKKMKRDLGKPTTGDRYVMRDHMIFDTQADAFIGAGDACYLLNEAQPKPATDCFAEATQSKGEWTMEWLEIAHRDYGGFKAIADAHNAALAAEREKAIGGLRELTHATINRLAKENEQLRKELAAMSDQPEPTTGEQWQHKLADFVNLILHGDDDHKAWLREAGEAFILGNPIPPARHRQFVCAYCHRGVESGIILLRVNKLGETPAIWICNEHFNYDDWKSAR